VPEERPEGQPDLAPECPLACADVSPPVAASSGPPDAERAGTAPGHPRLAALVEVVACSGFPTQVAIAGLLSLGGLHPFDARGRLSVPYVFILSLADALALVALAVWFLRLHGERARGVLLGSQPLLRESLLGVLQIPAVFMLAVAVMAVVSRFAPWLRNVPHNPMEGLIGTPLDAWLFVVVAIVGGGIREEVQRAFILHRFEQHLGGAWVGLILFSLVFGAGHVIQGRDVALTTAALGMFWGVVYLRRRSITSTVVSHSCFNAVEILRFALQRAAGV
jgi:membrane protease YdiL (CAAX protease family)